MDPERFQVKINLKLEAVSYKNIKQISIITFCPLKDNLPGSLVMQSWLFGSFY